jgi:DNA-binding transcriptional LysR family regulator
MSEATERKRSARALPSLDLLRGFDSAARHLNFTRAADELFLTQSAVSRQIQALEERLRVRLFIRLRRGLRLTAEGERLHRAVQGALRQVQDALDSLQPAPDSARVTVTSTMAFCSLWLVPRLGAFHAAHPDVDVRIAANDRVLNLDRERIDLSVRYARQQDAPAGAHWLFSEVLTPVCSPALLAQRPLRRPQHLSRHVLLHIEDPDNPSPWLGWHNWLDAVGLHRLEPAGAVRFNYFDQCVRAALAGQGVALGRLPLVQDLLQDGSLVAPFSERFASTRSYWLVRAEASAARPQVAQFAEWLIGAVRGTSPAPPPPPGRRTARKRAANPTASPPPSPPPTRSHR